jgi:hypothetical protein
VLHEAGGDAILAGGERQVQRQAAAVVRLVDAGRQVGGRAGAVFDEIEKDDVFAMQLDRRNNFLDFRI